MIAKRNTRLTISNLKTPSQINEFLKKKQQFQTQWTQDQIIRFYNIISKISIGKDLKKKKIYETKQYLDQIQLQFRKEMSRNQIQYFALKQAYNVIQNKINKNKRYNGNWFSYVPGTSIPDVKKVCREEKYEENKENENAFYKVKKKTPKNKKNVQLQHLIVYHRQQIDETDQKTNQQDDQQRFTNKIFKKRKFQEKLLKTEQLQQKSLKQLNNEENSMEIQQNKQNLKTQTLKTQKTHQKQQEKLQNNDINIQNNEKNIQNNEKNLQLQKQSQEKPQNLFQLLKSNLPIMKKFQIIDKYYFFPYNFQNQRSKRIYDFTLDFLDAIGDPLQEEQFQK